MPPRHLIIDLAVCDRCQAENGPCAVECSSFNREAEPGSACASMLALREKVTFELVCRRCAVASCILACPFNALEKTEDGIIRRHNLRCVSCKSCAIACPFGTIYAELLPFYSADYESSCGACLERIAAVGAASAVSVSKPACTGSCPEGALEYREIEPGEEDILVIDDRLAARLSNAAQRWVKSETAA